MLGTNQRVLVYVGCHVGNSLAKHIQNFDVVYAFEANPMFCSILSNKFAKNKNVSIVNAAVCAEHGGVAKFNISENDGDSSSLLEPNNQNSLYSKIKTKNVVYVPKVCLSDFFKEKNINKIDLYVSDLQGYDFIVLKTLKEMIVNKQIHTIQCEVLKNNKIPIYENKEKSLENTEENFDNFLSDYYDKIATGWGHLEDGVFNDVPSDWCEWDVKWRVK